MNQVSFLAELQRRHVYKVGAAYCVAGWLLVQIVTQVFPIFHVADQVQQWLVLAVVGGFPVALVLAWLFDITPQGIVRTDSASASSTNTVTDPQQRRNTDRRLNYLLMLLLVVAAGDAAYEHFLRGHAQVEGDAHSIAVLPLVNESDNADNEYFADGLSEELISALAQIGDLKVIGRSSSFQFKHSNESSRIIGEKLGVARLLEGTVRKQGDRVRIVAELINASDGRELWSSTYDRELKDLFAVQSEIATAVADSLKLTLLGDRGTAGGGARSSGVTANVEAHDAYLQGHFYMQRGNLDDYRRAIQYFDKAIVLDPGYALAYAERSECWTWIADQSTTDNVMVSRDNARSDATKAVAIDTSLADAHAALGWVLFFEDWKFAEGLAELQRASSLAPTDAKVNEVLVRVLLYSGRVREAEVLARKVTELDPLSFQASNSLARVLTMSGRYEEASNEARRGAQLQPGAFSNHRWQVIAAVFHHDAAGALSEAGLEPGNGYRWFEAALALTIGSDRQAADAALQDLIKQGQNGLAYQIAEVYAQRGENDKVFEWLDRAYAQHDTGLLVMRLDPLLKNQRDDPRFVALVAKMGLPKPE